MGLCVSKQAVVYSHDEEGYLERTTIINPTRDEKQYAKAQRREMIAGMGKRQYNSLQPVVESASCNYKYNIR